MESRHKKLKITRIKSNRTMRPGEAYMFTDDDTLYVSELEFNSLLKIINEALKVRILTKRIKCEY